MFARILAGAARTVLVGFTGLPLGRSLVVSLVVESLGEALFSEGVGGILIEDGRVFLDCLVVVAVASVPVGAIDEELDFSGIKRDGAVSARRLWLLERGFLRCVSMRQVSRFGWRRSGFGSGLRLGSRDRRGVDRRGYWWGDDSLFGARWRLWLRLRGARGRFEEWDEDESRGKDDDGRDSDDGPARVDFEGSWKLGGGVERVCG